MPLKIRHKMSWFALVVGVWAMPASAEDIPDLTLRYRELSGRQEFPFVMGKQTASKPAGFLNWEFPPTGFATVGFETAPMTLCIEPLVPVFPGTDYPFRIEQFGQPRDFAGLKNDEAGKKAAARRTKFVRELYGRYYPDAAKDPAAQAAFQTALWELIAETDVPDGPMPFNLFAGTYKANFKNEAESPEYVKTAQKQVQSLTGDDAPFSDSIDLAGLELVRLTGLANTAGVVGQSQLALRNRAGSANLNGPFGGEGNGPGGGGGLGGLAGASPLNGLGGFGGGGGGSPFVGGGGGVGGGGNSAPASTTTTPMSTVPTVNPIGTITNPGGISPSNPGGNNPGGNNPVNPTDPTDPTTPEPIPAPPAVILGLIAVGALGLRRRFAKKTA